MHWPSLEKILGYYYVIDIWQSHVATLESSCSQSELQSYSCYYLLRSVAASWCLSCFKVSSLRLEVSYQNSSWHRISSICFEGYRCSFDSSMRVMKNCMQLIVDSCLMKLLRCFEHNFVKFVLVFSSDSVLAAASNVWWSSFDQFMARLDMHHHLSCCYEFCS